MGGFKGEMGVREPASGDNQIVSRNHEFELILGLPGFLCWVMLCFSDFCGCSAVVRLLT